MFPHFVAFIHPGTPLLLPDIRDFGAFSDEGPRRSSFQTRRRHVRSLLSPLPALCASLTFTMDFSDLPPETDSRPTLVLKLNRAGRQAGK